MTLAAEFEHQGDRIPSWLVVFFAAGIGVYFARSTDDGALVLIVVLGVAVAAGWAMAVRLGRSWWPFACVAAIVAGFAAAHVRTAVVSGPILDRAIRGAAVEGRVREVQRQPNFVRVVLEDVTVERIDRPPAAIRLTMLARYGAPRVGQRIATSADLRPPELPPIPGGFQFQRFLYFERIGATAFTLAPWRTIDDVAALPNRFEAVRRDISDRILAAVPGDSGAVAVALITGEQSLIRERVQDDYRASGLAHLLSISGVHMSLLAAVVFAMARRLLALWPYVALRFDTKKIAAAVGLGATAFYLSISGASVPAVRAFMMVAVVLIAVLLDRRALSLRTVSWAALIVLVFFPESLVGPSFQMSFLAVVALIALYEYASLRPLWRSREGGWQLGQGLKLYVGGLLVTDVVAGSITSLIAAYHFSNIPAYSALGNLVAAPITGLWIMPWGLISLALMPAGGEGLPLTMMGLGVGAINSIAAEIASWPSAQLQVPPMSVAALVSAGAGVLFVALWRGRLRWVGLAPIAFAALQPWFAAAPDLIVAADGGLMAVSDARGRLVFVPGRAERFVRSVWAERYGRSNNKWPPADRGLACDAAGCVLTREGQRVAIALTSDALADDCGAAAVVLAPGLRVSACGSSAVYDRRDFRRDGTHAVWFRGDQVEIETVRDVIGWRPWNGADVDDPSPRISSGGTDPPDDPGP